MPQIEINKAACTGCDVCVEICPTDVLRLDAEKKAFAAYEQDCQACFLCEWEQTSLFPSRGQCRQTEQVRREFGFVRRG